MRPSPDPLLAAYDEQLRGESEVVGTLSWDRAGPLWRGKYPDGGFVSYQSLDGYHGAALDRLIRETIAYFASDPEMGSFEWKTLGHDAPADLTQRLESAGLVAEEVETVMVGEAAALAVDVPLAGGVVVRRVDDLPERAGLLCAAATTQRRVFGRGSSGAELLERVERSCGRTEVWVAEVAGEVVSAGRLELVPGTNFAGLWGGATLPEWRGHGIYRALTAARAIAAMTRGVRYLHSDCTEMSRPILERSGLRPVTTTTPYIWTRGGQAGVDPGQTSTPGTAIRSGCSSG